MWLVGTLEVSPHAHPELVALDGVPQPAEHHPEIDTLVHVGMVLEQARKLTADPRVHFAALVHDLGKGLTPRELLPKHHDHEARGVPLVRALGARLGVPDEWIALGELVARWHTHVHRAEALSPKGFRSLFRELGLVGPLDKHGRPAPVPPDELEHREDAFSVLLLAAEADARGRRGFEDRPYSNTGVMRDALARFRAGTL